jgi:hypothetical protein
VTTRSSGDALGVIADDERQGMQLPKSGIVFAVMHDLDLAVALPVDLVLLDAYGCSIFPNRTPGVCPFMLPPPMFPPSLARGIGALAQEPDQLPGAGNAAMPHLPQTVLC